MLGENGLYQTSRPYTIDFIIKSSALIGFELDLRTVFDEDIDDWTIMKETEAKYKVPAKAKSI